MPTKITIRGVEYATRKEAAAALGVSVSTVHSAVSKWNIDSIGLRKSKPQKRPVRIGSFSAPSVREAERRLGYSHTTILKRLNAGDVEWFEQASRGAQNGTN